MHKRNLEGIGRPQGKENLAFIDLQSNMLSLGKHPEVWEISNLAEIQHCAVE